MPSIIANSITSRRPVLRRQLTRTFNRRRTIIQLGFIILACLLVVAGTELILARRESTRTRLESRNGLIASQSQVSEVRMPNWKTTAIKLPKDTNINQIQMVNAIVGWLWGHDTDLYRTSDGGDHWTRMQLRLPPRSYITDAYFASADVGWIAASKTELDFDAAKGVGTYDNATWIFETRDAGKTLINRLVVPDGQIAQIHFVDANEGWAIGRMLSKQYPERDSSLVLHTSSGGRVWENLSAELPEDTGIAALRTIDQTTTLMLAADGSIYKAADMGRKWERVDRLNYKEEDQVAIWRFKLSPGGRPYVIAGASALEGTQTVFATKNRGQEWNVNQLNNIHITDAIFLSDSEVLACGSMRLESEMQKPELQQAVLLYSPDIGKTWNILSRYPQSTMLTALANTDSNHALAVGFQGLILKVDLPSRSDSR